MEALNVLQRETTLVNLVLLLVLLLLCKCFIFDVQNLRSCMCQREIQCSVNEMFHTDQHTKLLIFPAFHRSYFLYMGKARFNKLSSSLCLLVPSLIAQYRVCPLSQYELLVKICFFLGLAQSYRKFIFCTKWVTN